MTTINLTINGVQHTATLNGSIDMSLTGQVSLTISETGATPAPQPQPIPAPTPAPVPAPVPVPVPNPVPMPNVGPLTIKTEAVKVSGVAGALGSAKHLAFHVQGGEIYKICGDHKGVDPAGPDDQDGRQEIIALNVQNGESRLVRGYWAPAGEVQLQRPDDAFAVRVGDESWRFVSGRVKRHALKDIPPNVAEQVYDVVTAWKPGAPERVVGPQPAGIDGNKAWDGMYDPFAKRVVIPVAAPFGLGFIVMDSVTGEDLTWRNPDNGNIIAFYEHDAHVAGMAPDFHRGVAWCWAHSKSKLLEINLAKIYARDQTGAVTEVATVPEPVGQYGGEAAIGVFFHPKLGVPVLFGGDHIFVWLGNGFQIFKREDGILPSGRRVPTSWQGFYDASGAFISVGGIDWEQGEYLGSFWRISLS